MVYSERNVFYLSLSIFKDDNDGGLKLDVMAGLRHSVSFRYGFLHYAGVVWNQQQLLKSDTCVNPV